MRRAELRSTMSVSLPWLSFAAVIVFMAPLANAQTLMVASTPDFVSAAGQSDHFEVLEAYTALNQTSDPRVRAFAQQMIQEHTLTSQSLLKAVIKSGMGTALPYGLSGDQQKLLGALQSQRGQDFNRTYAKQQVLAHQQALIVDQSYAEHGSNADIQAWARSAVPIIQRHLLMAERMTSDVGG